MKIPTKSLRVVGFAGSLRKDSLNRLLLRSAISLAPQGMVVEELDISAIPLFNADLEEEGIEDLVKKLKLDLADHNISEEEIRKKIEELNAKAESEFK